MDRRAEAREAAIAAGGAIAAALALALGAYLLLEATRPSRGVVGLSFLVVLPAALSALAAVLADPFGRRPLRSWLRVPLWLLLAVVVLSLALLREGLVCVVMLAIPWTAAGMAGAWAAWSLRRRLARGRTLGVAALALPLLAMAGEPLLPVPETARTVARSQVVEAPPEAVWPLLLGIPDVGPHEGRWTVTQDLIGVPRPLGARLLGEGVGAERLARWEGGIRFREVVTAWEPGRRIAWRFAWDDMSGWAMTDRHLLPSGPLLRVTTGGYRLEPLAGGRSRVTLETAYVMRTPLPAYAALWGEVILGDLERNILGVIAARAEGRAG